MVNMPSRGNTPDRKKVSDNSNKKSPTLIASSFQRIPLSPNEMEHGPRHGDEHQRSSSVFDTNLLITEIPEAETSEEDDTDSLGELLEIYDEEDEDDEETDTESDKELDMEDESDEEQGGYETDLEIDGDAWARGRESFDRTGFKDYVVECEKLGVVPVKYFIEHSQKKVFCMKNHGLGPLGIQAMTKAIELNFILEKIDLEGNDIGGHGAACLSDALKDNTTVVELNLGNNEICSQGIESICTMLLENTTILSIDLSGNKLRDCDGTSIGDMLMKNSTLQKLYLRNNEFEENTARCLRNSLCNNEYLKILDLSWNFFRAESCYYIADMVKDNYGLKYLNLCMNGLADVGAGLIAHALKANQCLVDLNLSNNRITCDGARQIAGALCINETLETLRLSQNPIGAEGAISILESIHSQNASTLTLLDIMGVIVCESFDKLHRHINDERREALGQSIDESNTTLLQVLHGGVLFRNKHIMYFDEKDALENFECDPLTKLRRIADKQKYRLIDVFKQMDTDKNWALSRTELIAGGKIMGMELSETEVDALIKNLDTDGDGEIDYDELMVGDLDARRAIRKSKAQQLIYNQREREGPTEVSLALGTRDGYD